MSVGTKLNRAVTRFMTCKADGVLGGWPGEEKRELGRSEGEA